MNPPQWPPQQSGPQASVASPAIMKGAQEIMQLFERTLSATQVRQPVLVDAEVQTEGKEMVALKEENDKLKTVTFEMGQHYTTLLQGLREKDNRIAELTAKLEAAEAQLKDAQKSKEDVQMIVSPQETYSELQHLHEEAQNLDDIELNLQNFLDIEDQFFDPDASLWNDGIDIHNTENSSYQYRPDPVALITPTLAPSSPQMLPTPRHLFAFMPSPSPSLSPSLAPPRHVTFRLPVRGCSEVPDSESEDTVGTSDSDQPTRDLTPAPYYSSPPWESDLPIPPRIFTPTISYIRQFRLVISPPHSDEDVIFYVNRSASPTSDEMSDD